MGSPSLQPDMEHESSELLLEEGFLDRLKDKYCCRLKVSHVMAEHSQGRLNGKYRREELGKIKLTKTN